MAEYENLTQEMIDYADINFDGDELCPYCGNETSFFINPVKKSTFTCRHCGEEIYPCSLCDCDLVDCGDCTDCRNKIIYSIWKWKA